MGSKYTTQSASGYNSSPPPDDGSVTAANKITWAGIKSKLADSIKTLADAINSQLVNAFNYATTSTSVNYTTVAADNEAMIEATGTITISLGDAATMGAGYRCEVYNKGTGTVTVALATNTNTLAGQVNGTVTLPPGASMLFVMAQSVLGYDIRAATGFAPFVLTGAAGTNTATANAPANLIALYNGLMVLWTPANTNTGALTLNITPSGGSALTAKNVFNDGAACVGQEAKASVPLLLSYDGTQFNIVGRREFKQPTFQAFTSGSAATYTTPAGATRIVVECWGPGGGGGAQATNAGGNGSGATTFSTLSAGAGNGAAAGASAGGTGGTASGGDINISGQAGNPGITNSATVGVPGGSGGHAPFMGVAGAGGLASNAGGAAPANTGGGGGGGGGSTAPAPSGPGGGGGAYCKKTITAPAGTYTYTVGTKGSGGSAGGTAGGNGADGFIYVTEFYD